MGDFRKLLTGFLAGEIDPMLHGRVETDQYTYGLSTCENFVPTNEGPIVKRPGFEYICDADDTASWLGAFRFSINQEYLIEWGEQKARFFTLGGRIETAPGIPFEVTTPYAAGDAPQLSTVQSYDRLYIDHGSHHPASLTRTSAVTFTHAPQEFLNGPFKDRNADKGVTVQASAATGAAITLTANSAIFLPGHVGALFQVEAMDYATVKAWEAGMDSVAVGTQIRSDGKIYRCTSTGGGNRTGTNPPTHTEGAEWDGLGGKDINDKGPYGVLWEYLHDRFGQVLITAVAGSGLTCTATVQRRLPDQVTTVPTYRWSHALFSDVEGWPSLVGIWQGRQLHFRIFELAASVVGDYGGGRVNFQSYTDAGTLAADLAFRRTMSTENPPLWVAADRKLLVGTADKELLIGPLNSAQAVAGDNISLEPQSFYGSEAVRPLQIGTQTLFVERGGRRLRGAGYDIGQDRYVPEDLTSGARHVTMSGVNWLAHQRIPRAMVYAGREDGQIIAHASTRLEVKGFSRIVPGGDARVICGQVIVGADGKSDELWVLVERQRADGLKREIWRQWAWRELGEDQRAAFFVDCGTQFTAAAGQSTFTGFMHLAGQAIAVLAAGGVIEGVTVAADGSFVLPETSVPAEPYTLTVGLGYTALAVTLRPNIDTRNGPSQGLKQRVRKVVMRVLETLGIRVGDYAGGDLEHVIERPVGAQMDNAIPVFTGDTPGTISSDMTRDGRVRWVSSDPLPAIINAAMLSLELDEDDA
ncbi:hypothetical protein [Novosphingobium guangzhouense]|uniref:Ubiquitin-activating enzyme E1 FCCH domain-containing protein n=1 Tax=Novosphingobium guangzhouense TaxID=1850347 RepID=A0A2K2G455_9SPHN|nr:hypothetical protein [Novosphingobium guangzhouense]PNU05807.1 hypothetical protein A8V01_14675 [Novosphingobium guangzhouense]